MSMGRVEFGLLFVDFDGKELRLLTGTFDRLQQRVSVYRWDGPEIVYIGQITGYWLDELSGFENLALGNVIAEALRKAYGVNRRSGAMRNEGAKHEHREGQH